MFLCIRCGLRPGRARALCMTCYGRAKKANELEDYPLVGGKGIPRRIPMTDVAKEKISQANRGKKHSPETRAKMSQIAKCRPRPYRLIHSGYIFLYEPLHHRSNVHGRVPEEILVMEKLLGRPLERGELVHHMNHNPSDNRPENLMLMGSPSEHRSLHAKKPRSPRPRPCMTREYRRRYQREYQRKWRKGSRQ